MKHINVKLLFMLQLEPPVLLYTNNAHLLANQI